MHFPGLVPLLIVLLLAFLLFGRPGRLSSVMEDLGKGIRGFRKGMSDEAKGEGGDAAQQPPQQVSDQSGANSTNTQSNGDRASS